MQIDYNNPQMLFRQRWQEVWPTQFLAIIAICQMLVTFIIIGTETWSMVLNIKYSFLFIGYITAFFFTITWISTFTVVCCNRGSRGCATHALVENIISVIASCILLAYDARFLNNPYTCFWPGDICYSTNWDITWDTLWNNYGLDTQEAKLIAIKVQLSFAAVMLLLSVLYIVIYIYTSLTVRTRATRIDPQTTIELSTQQPTNPMWPTQQPAWPLPLIKNR